MVPIYGGWNVVGLEIKGLVPGCKIDLEISRNQRKRCRGENERENKRPATPWAQVI